MGERGTILQTQGLKTDEVAFGLGEPSVGVVVARRFNWSSISFKVGAVTSLRTSACEIISAAFWYGAETGVGAIGIAFVLADIRGKTGTE